jgi:hypothetical protein
MRPPRRRTIASRSGWNRLVAHWFRSRLLEVRVLEPPAWRWPWHPSLRWDPLGEQWTVSLRPGWCESPTASPSPLARVPARLAGRSPAALEAEDPETPVDAALADGPRIPIRPDLWRAVGTDAVVPSGEAAPPLPEPIARRGVLGPVRVRETAAGLVRVVEGLESDRRDAALARAVEIVLEHGRETVDPALRAEGSQLVLAPRFLPPSPRGPVLRVLREWSEPVPRPRYAEIAAGLPPDPGIDRIRLGTLWLTSPRGEPEGAVPDARWRPWAQHRVRRNLAYELTGPELRTVEPFRLAAPVSALAGGAGNLAIAAMVEELDSRASEIEALLGRLETGGAFRGV